MSTTLGTEITLPLEFADALARTREALKAEGFGVISEIDMRQAFKDKLDREFRPYVILGACNPPMAFAAVSAHADVGLLLPCNVTVEAGGDASSVVRLIDPLMMMSAGGHGANADVRAIAQDAATRLLRVAQALGRIGHTS
jgi:uncharacterized protein (DUF302 family)